MDGAGRPATFGALAGSPGMSASIRLAALVLVLPLSACLSIDLPDAIERTVTKTFTVQPHATVRVKLRGGSISAETGNPGAVTVTLVERVNASSDSQIDALLADYDITLKQEDGDVVVSARRRSDDDWKLWKGNRVHISARLVVPSDAKLDFDTSGGSIAVRGDRDDALKADTSGGSISVDGGRGELDVDTSGGSISIARVLTSLKADTSGGSISVGYVGPHATNVDLDTSGGSIRVGVDPNASLRVDAGTSGGGVGVDGLAMSDVERGRSHIRGSINGGTGRLSANTSGGSITIKAARE
jgi:hypothetical protein